VMVLFWGVNGGYGIVCWFVVDACEGSGVSVGVAGGLL